jgi:thiamine monophosphate synthase
VNNYRLKYYIFLDELNEKTTKNIQKLKKKKIDLKLIISEKNFYSILDFAKKSKIPFYVVDDIKLAVKHKALGVFITGKNKSFINIPKNTNKIKIVGGAHNQYEYFIKKRQGCSTIFLSPIFYNKKYTLNKILHINKFNLITLNWKTSIGALGGISLKNLKLIKLTKSKSIGIKSLIAK